MESVELVVTLQTDQKKSILCPRCPFGLDCLEDRVVEEVEPGDAVALAGQAGQVVQPELVQQAYHPL